MKSWISAMRLRTLPLSIAGIITGGAMAYSHDADQFENLVFLFAILTALGLQILSNFANDYGDFQNGADNDNRVGPQRAVHSGEITPAAMKNAIIITAVITLGLGISLLLMAFHQINFRFVLYFIIGIASIIAALKYTMGKNPYGYRGLGDVFVFVFFGIVSAVGTYFLLVHQITYAIFLPSISIGAWSTAVLNLNNLRDIENDKASGKITIPVRLGLQNGLLYHYALIATPFICNFIFAGFSGNMLLVGFTGLSLIIAYLLFKPLFHNPTHKIFDNLLKKTALFSLLFTLLFVTGLIFG